MTHSHTVWASLIYMYTWPAQLKLTISDQSTHITSNKMQPISTPNQLKCDQSAHICDLLKLTQVQPMSTQVCSSSDRTGHFSNRCDIWKVEKAVHRNQSDSHCNQSTTCHSFRVAYDQSAVGLLECREQRHSCHCEVLRAHLEIRHSTSLHTNLSSFF